MHERLLTDEAERIWVVVPERGTDAVATIEAWARRRGVTAARVSAIGGFDRAVLGWFDWDAKDYRRIEVGEQCEVVALLGDIAVSGDSVKLHVHAVLGQADGTAKAGHLLEGIVRPTLEVMVVQSPAHLARKHDPITGLALLDPESR
ncbi:MAG TPA: PPC domain-containing DNA-binding protein [Acidimicrobiales bacterium]|jgi:hypothetical protein